MLAGMPSDLVYQIFPDRWRREAPEPRVAAGAWRWRNHPIRFSSDPRQLTVNPSDQYTFYGGDLAGVTASLPYLQELGVGTLYLTPIFQARSTHRYDAVDYGAIDPILGTRADFSELATRLRAGGIRLFLDGVFNHTSEDHPWHRDAARRGRFYVPDAAGGTMTWQGGGTLPKLDTQRPAVAREILRVLDAWPETDGWRLDAAHLLPQAFLARLRKHAHPRPIVVEDWFYARHYLARGLADGVTNMLFREAMRSYFREDCSPETLFERLGLYIDRYPRRAMAHTWNLLDNHDLPRFRSLVGRDRLFRALVLLFTLPGTPLLYQGTEIGMEGKTEGESRSPMIWDRRRWDLELLEHVRELNALRRENPVLMRGSFAQLAADNRSRTLVFERRTASARAVVGVNDGHHAFRYQGDGFRMDLPPGCWQLLIESRGIGRRIWPHEP